MEGQTTARRGTLRNYKRPFLACWKLPGRFLQNRRSGVRVPPLLPVPTGRAEVLELVDKQR